MKRLSYIVLTLASLLNVATLSAQLSTLPTRQQLDSMANPSLSTTASRGIRADKEHVELGEIDGTRSISIEFILRNTTSRSVTIKEYRSTCGCLRVESHPTTLHAGESATLRATLTPSGHNGAYERRILVYTSLDEKHPTERLSVSYTLHSSDKFAHLTRQMGPLRMSRKGVLLDNLKVGTTRTERIIVANTSDKSITLSARPTIEGLQFSLKPATLKPDEQGEITISYTPEQLPEKNLETMLIVEGIEAKPTDRMIRIILKR